MLISNSVKILEDALKKFKSIPALQAALIRHGVMISTAALYKAKAGKTTEFSRDVNLALTDLVYDGDGNKLKKAMESDRDKK
jgi:hypothetical protein